MMELLIWFTAEVKTQFADIQTKPLKLATFVKLHGLLGVCSHAATKEDFVEG